MHTFLKTQKMHGYSEMRFIFKIKYIELLYNSTKMQDNIKSYERFKKGLKEYTLKVEDFQLNYVFAGGDINSGYYKYWERSCKGETEAAHKDKCICGIKIKKNCYVINRDETDIIKRVLVIGSCCIKQFIRTGIKKTCGVCKKIHKRRDINLCSDCEKIYCEKCYKSITDGLCINCLGNKYNLDLDKINVEISEGKFFLKIGEVTPIIKAREKITLDKYNNMQMTVSDYDLNKLIKQIDKTLIEKFSRKDLIYKQMLNFGKIKVSSFKNDMDTNITKDLTVSFNYVWKNQKGEYGITANVKQ